MSLLYRITCDEYVLMEQGTLESTITEAILTREINDGMFDGSLEFAMTYENPHVDKIHLMTSTIFVTEIYNGQETVLFRGRPISIKPTLDWQVRVTCEGDLKFLMDIPDVFSKMVSRSTTYKAGSETNYRDESMRTIPTGQLVPKSTSDNTDEVSRFGENRIYSGPDIDGNNITKTVYRSVDMYTILGRGSKYTSYILGSKDVGKTFTVEFRPSNGVVTKYEMPLKTCKYRTAVYSGSGMYENYNRNIQEVDCVARYLGKAVSARRIPMCLIRPGSLPVNRLPLFPVSMRAGKYYMGNSLSVLFITVWFLFGSRIFTGISTGIQVLRRSCTMLPRRRFLPYR